MVNELKTKRLIIKKATKDNISLIIELENNKDNSSFVWQDDFDTHLKYLNDKNHIVFMIYEKESNDIVGYTLIHVDSNSNIFELRRIIITKKGIGYGKEIMKKLFDYAFNSLNINRFWLDTYPDNKRGIKLYESLNMVKEGVLRQNYKSSQGYKDQIIYSMLREEYK